MDRIRNKLREKDGISILMGLLFMLVCVMVGTVVLTASTAASGKLAKLREREQDYLTVASAAKLMRNRIGVLTYTHTRTTITIDGVSSTPTNEEKLEPSDSKGLILEKDLKAMCAVLPDPEDPEHPVTPGVKTFTIKGPSSDWKDVYGTMSMGSDGKILMKLWLGDETDETKKHNRIEMEFVPDGPDKQTVVTTEELEALDGTIIIKTTSKTTTICSWPEAGCTIKKGT